MKMFMTFLILMFSMIQTSYASVSNRETLVVGVSQASPTSPKTFSNSTSTTAGDRIIASIAARGTGTTTISAVDVMNGASVVDSLTLDVGPVINLGGAGVRLWVYSAVSSGGSITGIRVTFSGSPSRMTVDAGSYSGLARTATAVNTSGSNTGNGTAITLNGSNISTSRSTMLFAAVVDDNIGTFTFGTATPNSAPATGFPSNPMAERTAQEELYSPTSSFNKTASINTSRQWASILIAYNTMPNHIKFGYGPTNLEKNLCNVTNFQFILRARTGQSNVSPIASSDFVVTSSEGTAFVSIGSCPVCGSVSNPTGTILTTSDLEILIYVVDSVPGTGKILTVDWSSGGESLTSDSVIYDVNDNLEPDYCP